MAVATRHLMLVVTRNPTATNGDGGGRELERPRGRARLRGSRGHALRVFERKRDAMSYAATLMARLRGGRS